MSLYKITAHAKFNTYGEYWMWAKDAGEAKRWFLRAMALSSHPEAVLAVELVTDDNPRMFRQV